MHVFRGFRFLKKRPVLHAGNLMGITGIQILDYRRRFRRKWGRFSAVRGRAPMFGFEGSGSYKPGPICPAGQRDALLGSREEEFLQARQQRGEQVAPQACGADLAHGAGGGEVGRRAVRCRARGHWHVSQATFGRTPEAERAGACLVRAVTANRPWSPPDA